MEKDQILENLAVAVADRDREKAKENAMKVINGGFDPLEAVEQGLSKGMDVVGRQFESGEAFLPELMMAADTFNAAMEILNPEIQRQKKQVVNIGTVLIATVKGDLHDIGKNIVATVMGTNGFEVVDIGINQSTLNIIEAAEKNNAEIIALSSLMTTTMPYQREVIDTLTQMEIRDKYIVLVGGGAVSKKWADEIGADGYAESAVEAVDIAKILLKSTNKQVG